MQAKVVKAYIQGDYTDLDYMIVGMNGIGF